MSFFVCLFKAQLLWFRFVFLYIVNLLACSFELFIWPKFVQVLHFFFISLVTQIRDNWPYDWCRSVVKTFRFNVLRFCTIISYLLSRTFHASRGYTIKYFVNVFINCSLNLSKCSLFLYWILFLTRSYLYSLLNAVGVQ